MVGEAAELSGVGFEALVADAVPSEAIDTGDIKQETGAISIEQETKQCDLSPFNRRAFGGCGRHGGLPAKSAAME